MESILKKRSRKGQGGFSLVEVLMAVFITAIIAIGVYSVYNTFYRQSDRQDKALEAQQNARVAIGLMERELVNAGYAAGTADIITEATPTSIEFIYSDPSTDPSESPTAGNRLQVRYGLQATGSVQYLVRRANNLSTLSTGSTDDVIPYVQNMTITYYDIDGNVIADTTTQPLRNTIKFASVEIIAQSKPEPGRNPKEFTVKTHIRLRNIGIGQTSLDATPPAAPLGIQVRDPGQCERLKVKWTENTEGDVMGYQVFYGTTSGAYTGIINIPLTVLASTNYSCARVSGTIECTIFPNNPVFAYTQSSSVTGTTYYVAVEAYDNSLNRSAFSAEVSGDPSPSSAVFNSGADDSTINPVKPVAVTGFTGTDGPSDGSVTLNWSAYDLTSSPDVTGFRVYRSLSPFASYPIDPNQAGIDWIAGEPLSGKPEIAKSATTYTDNGPNLMGCTRYYYAIAPVNCDPTLITDEGGDPASKKYTSSDYAVAYGDGAGAEADSPSGADTAPPDTLIPAAPAAFDARAGWKRVAIALTQPSDIDLYQTCIYANQGAAYPALLGTKDAIGCFNPSSGIKLFESDGALNTSEVPISGSTSFWHNSMVGLTTSPSLAETGVYSYTAVSFDLCGNGSPASSAQATTTLCGEDPPVLPDVDSFGYGQPAPGKPPAVSGVTGAGCGGAPESIDLAWTEVSSNISASSTEFNPYDLAGYRIFRGTDSLDWSSATLLNVTAPFWGAAYSDANSADGGPYYYRVVSTDCPYEKNSPAEGTIKADMSSGYLRSAQYGPIYPGRIKRDEMCTGALPCTQDLHRETLTGVSLTASNTASPSSSFYHNTVTMFLENTSGSTMTIQGASVSWVNSSALLREVKIGGGRGGVGQTLTSIGAGSTTPVVGNPPYTSAVANIALTAAQIPALARYVPITFEFKDSFGTKNVDMRDDQLLITLNVRNDSTGTTTCRSYMTVSLAQEGVIVSYGPSVSAAQQDKPASPTFGYAVPGPTGLNTVPSGTNGSIVVDAGTTVTVSASIEGLTTDASTGLKVPVSSATLYYVATAKTVTVAPASGYTSVAMTNPSGNTWRGAIPTNDNMRVWYYIVANDEDGNFDRDPEIEHGAYVYDQKSFSICDVTPATPTDFVALNPEYDFTVALSWTEVTTYSGGSPRDASDSFTYRIFRNGTQIVASQTGTTYTDTVPSNGIYTYTVMARNACASPAPKESAVATTAACAGSSASATLTVSPTTIFRGGSYTVNIVDCYALTGPTGLYYLSQEIINSTSGFTGFNNASSVDTLGGTNTLITETGPATATFETTVITNSDPTDSTRLATLASDTITVTYPYATPPTRTISVVVDPCTNTPKAPTGLTGTVSGQNMTLNWTAVTQNTDNSAITDLAGYRVYEKVCAKNRPNCTGADIVADWFLRSSTAAGTTTATLNADNGAVNQRIYYFKATAIDSCGTVRESGFSNTWNETN